MKKAWIPIPKRLTLFPSIMSSPFHVIFMAHNEKKKSHKLSWRHLLIFFFPERKLQNMRKGITSNADSIVRSLHFPYLQQPQS
jgi:hypothetical protein